MSKIYIYGKIKETQKILNLIKTKTYTHLYPLKNIRRHANIAVINNAGRNFHPLCDITIINTDIYPINLISHNTAVITVGLNSKANITLSSINDTRIMFCIKNALRTLSGNYIYEQEFPINTDIKNVDILLTAITAAILCDVKITDFQKFFLHKNQQKGILINTDLM